MLDFPLNYIPEPQECYDFLLLLLHKNNLRCPDGHILENCYVYKRGREPILDYRCKICGKCFNIFTGTILKGTKYNVVQIIRSIDGIIQDVPVAQISREIGVGRKGLMINKHKFEELAKEAKDIEPQYVNWDKVFQSLDLSGGNQGYKIKNFIEKVASHKPYLLYWKAFLQNVEDWEIEDIPGEENTTRLVLKLKWSGCYAVSRTSFDDIKPKSGIRIRKELTRVHKLGSTYLLDKKRNEIIY